MMKNGYLVCSLLLWSVAALPAAVDENNILLPFISQNILYDSNLFRLPAGSNALSLQPGSSKSDVVDQISIGSNVNYALGRQKFTLSLKVSDNIFVNNGFLNNISTDNLASWKWEFGKQLSGELGYTYTRSLSSYDWIQQPIKNILTNDNAFINLNYAWHPRWRINTNLKWTENTNSNVTRERYDNQIARGLIGINYLTPSKNSVGMQYIFTNVDYTKRIADPILGDNRYQVHTTNALLTWNLTKKTHLDADIGYTIVQSGHYDNFNFNGETWHLNLIWAATDKMQFSITTWKDLWPSQTSNSSYLINEGVGFMPTWTVTSKLSLNGKVSYETYAYSGTASSNQKQQTLSDQINQIEAIYEPIRNVETHLSLRAYKRDSNVQSSSFMDYNVLASVKVKF